MHRSALLWIIAFIFTLATGIYQRMTGPTYPMKGHVTLNGKEIDYVFDRSHGGDGGHQVRVETRTAAVVGVMEWKRFKSNDEWASVPMSFDGVFLSAELPHQPPAGKVVYRVSLVSDGATAVLPEEGGVVLRFKGDVPTWIIVLHVIVIFGAMLLSTRTGLEFFNLAPRLSKLAWWTVGFLAIGGMILGPVVQKYAFDAYWTGWPFGQDLTDNKTLVALVAWVVAALAIPRVRNPRAWVLGAAVVVLVVFLIPHSLLGSELDYSKLNQAKQTLPVSPVK